MKKVIIPAVFFLSISLMAFQCNKGWQQCENVMCTTQFLQFGVEINSANPLGNIAVKVKDVNNNMIIRTSTTPMAGSTNKFLIIDDGDFGFLGQVNQTEQFIVEVWQNSVLKQTLAYEFGRDCCHVFKKSGPDAIQI